MMSQNSGQQKSGRSLGGCGAGLLIVVLFLLVSCYQENEASSGKERRPHHQESVGSLNLAPGEDEFNRCRNEGIFEREASVSLSELKVCYGLKSVSESKTFDDIVSWVDYIWTLCKGEDLENPLNTRDESFLICLQTQADSEVGEVPISGISPVDEFLPEREEDALTGDLQPPAEMENLELSERLVEMFSCLPGGYSGAGDLRCLPASYPADTPYFVPLLLGDSKTIAAAIIWSVCEGEYGQTDTRFSQGQIDGCIDVAVSDKAQEMGLLADVMERLHSGIQD